KDKFNLTYKDLDYYKNKNLIKTSFDLIGKQKINYNYFISLNKNIEDIKLPKNANKQKDIISYLNDNNKVEEKKLLSVTNSSKSSLKSLKEKGLIKVSKKEVNESLLD